MSMTARGDGIALAGPEGNLVAKLRFLAVGVALHSKGARLFVAELEPFGLVIRATDRSLPRVLTSQTIVPFDKLEDNLTPDRTRLVLCEIDTLLDRQIRRVE